MKLLDMNWLVCISKGNLLRVVSLLYSKFWHLSVTLDFNSFGPFAELEEIVKLDIRKG